MRLYPCMILNTCMILIFTPDQYVTKVDEHVSRSILNNLALPRQKLAHRLNPNRIDHPPPLESIAPTLIESITPPPLLESITSTLIARPNPNRSTQP